MHRNLLRRLIDGFYMLEFMVDPSATNYAWLNDYRFIEITKRLI